MAATETETITASFLVRRIAPEDATQVAELSAQLGYKISTESVAERIRALTTCAEEQGAFIACTGTVVIGWIEAAITHHLQSPPHTLITGLVVRDGNRSLGVGKRLCAEIESWSRDHGIAIVRVTSRMTRKRAHKFYLREGYTQTKTSAVFEKVLL